MSWELAHPAGLAFLGLLAPLVVLYILKVRRQRHVVPSTWLWRSARRDLEASTPFRRLVPSVPLLLEALAIAALALAVAGPRRRSQEIAQSRVVLIVDVSASMGALEAGSTRLGLAIHAAEDAVARVRPGTDVMLLAAGREPRLVSPFERDPERLFAAVRRIAVEEVEGRLGRALAMAAQELTQRGGGEIVLISDGAAADAAALVAPGVPLRIVEIGTSGENTAIVRVDAATVPHPATRRDRVQVFAAVEHFGRRARDVFVTLRQRNVEEPLASRKLRLAPGERAPVLLEFDAAPGDVGSGLSVELSPPDQLASDDIANLRVPESDRMPVVLAPKAASPWLRRALQADGGVDLLAASLEELTASQVPDDALVVLDGACPTALPGRDLLIVNPPRGPCRTVELGELVERPPVTSWLETDGRLRFVDLDGVSLTRARRVLGSGPHDALLRTTDGALIVDVSSPGRTGTLLAFDVGETNWPLQVSFVVFVRNVVEQARAQRAGSAPGPLRAGEPMSLRVSWDAERVEVEGPAGLKESVAVRSGVAVLPAPTRVGFFHASWQGSRPGSTLLPVSLTSATESRIEPRRLELAGGRRSPQSASAGVVGADWLLALLGLGLIAFDVWWATRRNHPSRRAPALPLPPVRANPAGARP